MSCFFHSDAVEIESKFREALDGLNRNITVVTGYDRPVLIEGANYSGIWLEGGPQEGLVYGVVNPQIALENHQIFFVNQRDDGYLHYCFRKDRIGASQIQMVVPIAATAYEVFQQYGDDEFLQIAYKACSRWDRWLAQYRDTRQTGLCEGFCEDDTGHDNSPRWDGLPEKCADGDARRCSPVDGLPYISPDLSASVYGGRLALAKMAETLKIPDEAERWRRCADETRRRILNICFDPADECFYDVDSNGQFVRIPGDAMLRVLGEHVVSQKLFDRIHARHLSNPRAFWTPFPFPSIAANDPRFVKPIPGNSWGGAAQALTAIRAPRWMEHYGKYADLVHLMRQWLKALTLPGAFFGQQIEPWNGQVTPGPGGYSPAMLVMLDFATRLYGVRRAGHVLEWTTLLPEGATYCRYVLETPSDQAIIETIGTRSTLLLANEQIAEIEGRCRIRTDLVGQILAIIGVEQSPQTILVSVRERALASLVVDPNQVVDWTSSPAIKNGHGRHGNSLERSTPND